MSVCFAVKRKSGSILESESRGRGLVVRFWGCNLRCLLCFAQSYAFRNWEGNRCKVSYSLENLGDKVVKEVRDVDASKLRWLRIEGGEPLTSPIHSEFTSRIVDLVARNLRVSSFNVIIQTNGLWLGKDIRNAKAFYEEISSILRSVGDRFRVAVEISFKGPNEKACEEYSGVKNKNIFNFQCDGFMNSLRVLEEYWREGVKIAVYPVAGFGFSFEDEVVIPIDPESFEKGVEIPLFHRDTWSNEFHEIINAFQDTVRNYGEIYRRYIESHGNRIHMYGLEFRGRKWQSAWINAAFRDPNLRDFARKYLRLNRRMLNLVGFLKNNLEKLGIREASDLILERARQMSKHFIELEPANHYPNL